MRVISGMAKGKRLKAPSGNDTRPVTDMIKEALFNVLGQNVIQAKFLDLFAGSGSVGIEALSRGAELVVFIDNSQSAVKTIEANLEYCNLSDNYQIYRKDVIIGIEMLKKKNKRFDLIYVDPPFTQEKIFVPVMKALAAANILSINGTLIIRTPRKMELQEKFKDLLRFRFNHYGESTLNYYKLNKEDNNNDGNTAHT